MIRFIHRRGFTALAASPLLAAALLLPAALPLAAHAQQTGDTSATPAKPMKKKARHKSAAVPSGSSANTPDPINPSASPEPPTPTTQGPPPPPTTPTTNTPVAPH